MFKNIKYKLELLSFFMCLSDMYLLCDVLKKIKKILCLFIFTLFLFSKMYFVAMYSNLAHLYLKNKYTTTYYFLHTIYSSMFLLKSI